MYQLHRVYKEDENSTGEIEIVQFRNCNFFSYTILEILKIWQVPNCSKQIDSLKNTGDLQKFTAALEKVSEWCGLYGKVNKFSLKNS